MSFDRSLARSQAAASFDRPIARAGRDVRSGRRLDKESVNAGAALGLAVLFIAVVATGVALCWKEAEVRRLYVTLEQLHAKRDVLQEDYGRLLIERAVYADPVVVENRARDLGMVHLPMPHLVRGSPSTAHWPHMVFWRHPAAISEHGIAHPRASRAE